jgi:hypothetical protein
VTAQPTRATLFLLLLTITPLLPLLPLLRLPLALLRRRRLRLLLQLWLLKVRPMPLLLLLLQWLLLPLLWLRGKLTSFFEINSSHSSFCIRFAGLGQSLTFQNHDSVFSLINTMSCLF